jgi:hypothetical protein
MEVQHLGSEFGPQLHPHQKCAGGLLGALSMTWTLVRQNAMASTARQYHASCGTYSTWHALGDVEI